MAEDSKICTAGTQVISDPESCTEEGDEMKGRIIGIPVFGFIDKVKTLKWKSSRLILLFLLNVIFIGTSSAAFMRIENKYLPDYVKKKKDSFDYLLDIMNDVTFQKNTGVNSSFWKAIADLHRPRCFKINNRHTENHLWNFWSSLDFCATLLTTIGYGNMSPRTTAGKLFTIAYSSLGIPLMALYLAIFSKGIYKMSRLIIRYCINCLRRIELEINSTTVSILSLIILTMLLGNYIGVLSYIMTITDSTDTFLSCFYFYTITLSTVGLGDMAMTEALPYVLIRIFLVFCVGLTLVTSVFNALRHLLASERRKK
ncbi:hypothetical protein ACHWQZ_G001017 [Mnemiopsis leidyi]